VKRTLALLLLVLSAQAGRAGPSAPEEETFFEVKVRPVLLDTCFRCHGGEKTSGGLRVDSRASLLKGGDGGPVLVPGRPDDSRLIQAIRHRPGADLRMPPRRRLPESTVSDLEAWVRRGAYWPASASGQTPATPAERHWAYRPVRKVEPPPDPSGWAAGPVDDFIAAGLRARGLRPAPPADKRTLLRRVTFDLVGLPPTPEEIAAFLGDASLDAYARVVDRLLASPHYGERWGRHWMDVVRYADTAGDNADYPVPEAARYRDYIIDSFNADRPYDAFVREQLAGDVLARGGPPGRYAEQVVATTYLALSRRYLTAPYEAWHLTLEDVIDTTGRAFLGLTLRCARCHDHKYDPVTRADYYALYGIFASTQFPYAGSEEFASMKKPREHFVPLAPAAETSAALATRGRQLDEVRAALGRLEKSGPREKVEALRAGLRTLERTNLPPDVPGAYAVCEGKPVDVPIQLGGDPDRPGPVVPRGVPKFLAGKASFAIAPGSSGRLELARWLTRPDHPLTARVLVNRVWQHHFGRGLVATPSNFGVRGSPPTHPELLDWLAATFVEDGWSIKKLHRRIVLSRTYQQASIADCVLRIADSSTPQSAIRNPQSADPGNLAYGRFGRRLDAEAIRDALLAASGRLDRGRPGPHPFPPLSSWGWTQHHPFKAVYPSDHRSVYLMTQRLQRHPFFALFDGPDPNVTTEARGTSTAPLQGLYFLNNPFVAEQARGLARRVRAAAADPARRYALACELTWGRPPTAAETEAALAYVRRYREEAARSGAAGDPEEEAWTSLARVLFCANEFVYID
jgi:hypothetical protein